MLQSHSRLTSIPDIDLSFSKIAFPLPYNKNSTPFMSIFHSKPDPFCSFSIDLGPLYIERVFDYILTKEGIEGVSRMQDADRLVKYVDYLNLCGSKAHPPAHSYELFYKGHFYQRLARCAGLEPDNLHYCETALYHYRDYLESSHQIDESRFYAQWQTGILQETMQYPWPLVEAALAKAQSIDPLRGEPIRQIIQHYMGEKKWAKALPFSCHSVEKYFNRSPIHIRRWFVDDNAYNWNVIFTRLSISRHLGTDDYSLNYPVYGMANH